MKKRLFVVGILWSVLFLFTACGSTSEAESEKTDESSSEAEEEEASDDRIVATTYAIAEFLDVLNIDAVGVPTSYKDMPERFKDVTEVGNPMDPDLETVLSLDPTHVLSVTTLKEDLAEPFADHNVPADFLDLESVEGMFAELEQLGETYDRVEEATDVIEAFEEKMAEVEEVIEGKEAPSVLILMGIPGSYIVGTEHSYIGDLVERVGGVNAVSGHDEEFISANTEYLQQLEPDVILRAVHGAPEAVVDMFNEEFAENDIWQHFAAVKNDRVYDLEETLFGTTANLAVDEALDELIPLLYPDES